MCVSSTVQALLTDFYCPEIYRPVNYCTMSLRNPYFTAVLMLQPLLETTELINWAGGDFFWLVTSDQVLLCSVKHLKAFSFRHSSFPVLWINLRKMTQMINYIAMGLRFNNDSNHRLWWWRWRWWWWWWWWWLFFELSYLAKDLRRGSGTKRRGDGQAAHRHASPGI